MELESPGMTPSEELLKEIFLSYLVKELTPEKKKNCTISFIISEQSPEEDIFGCQELKDASFFLTVTYRDGEIVCLTTSRLPLTN